MTTSPSGDQHPITHGHYRAVVTQSGATLRSLSYDGRDLVQGFPEDRMASGGRGQVLVPWPNRIRDGAYTFDSAPQQLPLSEPARRNASHGLVRWVSWQLAANEVWSPWVQEVRIEELLQSRVQEGAAQKTSEDADGPWLLLPARANARSRV